MFMMKKFEFSKSIHILKNQIFKKCLDSKNIYIKKFRLKRQKKRKKKKEKRKRQSGPAQHNRLECAAQCNRRPGRCIGAPIIHQCITCPGLQRQKEERLSSRERNRRKPQETLPSRRTSSRRRGSGRWQRRLVDSSTLVGS
jgi:hypothetical protein